MNITEKSYNWAYGLTTRKSTTHLILHHAAANASPDDIHRWHLGNGWAGIAYHYYVRKDGTIYRGRPENMTGGHTTNWNYCSIGICFEGNFESETMSAAQRKAGQELVADIVRRYPGITVGKHSAYQATACPGRNFPFDEIVSGRSDEPQNSDAEKSNAPSEWAKEACDWAVEAGLFQGDDNGNYNWQGGLTREAFATVLHRYHTTMGG